MAVDNYGPLGNPLPDLDDDANFPEQVSELSKWTADRVVPAAADPAVLRTMFPVLKQGLLVNVLSVGEVWMYRAAYNASTNPGGMTPAGWYPVNNKGRLLNVYEIGWPGEAFFWQDGIRLLKEFGIPPQGSPYRIQAQATGEVYVEDGAPGNAPRYDLQITAGGAYGTTQGEVIGYEVAQPGVKYQKVDMLPTAKVYSGELRVSLRAARLFGLPAPVGQRGYTTEYNRNFTISTWSA